MLSALDVLKAARSLGFSGGLSDAEAALQSVDRSAVEREVQARYRVELWDRKSPINGVPAETVLKRPDVPPEGDIYLIYIDGALRFFQPHDPDQGGMNPIPQGQGLEVGQRHVARLVEAEVDQRVLDMALAKLLG